MLVESLIPPLIYGLTIGSILYLVSVGLTITFGYMRLVNFSHALFYAISPYILFLLCVRYGFNYLFSLGVGLIVVVILSYFIERYALRRLYRVRLDYSIIASYAILLMGIDTIKTFFGATPIPLREPITIFIELANAYVSLYRLLIVAIAIIVHISLILFFRYSVSGKIIVAFLEEPELISSFGIDTDKYFSLIFILGSVLAGLGGVLYGPISAAYPYMGLDIIQLCFVVVVAGGISGLLRTINGTLISAYIAGMIYSISGQVWGPSSTISIFVLLLIIVLVRPQGLFGNSRR
jgi:branched-subunit amino acid ABC-type transport system permease component